MENDYSQALEVYEELDEDYLKSDNQTEENINYEEKGIIQSPGSLYFAVSTLEDAAMVEKIASLMKKKDINQQNLRKQSALHIACMKENLEIIEILLRHGADVNIQDANGCTPLYYACQKNLITMADLLIKYGANVYIADNYQNTPAHIACNNSYIDIIYYFINIKINFNYLNSDNKNPLDLLINESENLNDYNNDLNKKVYFISQENLKIADLFIENGVNSSYYKMDFIKNLIQKFKKKYSQENRDLHEQEFSCNII